jgi:hypothetical protein
MFVIYNLEKRIRNHLGRQDSEGSGRVSRQQSNQSTQQRYSNAPGLGVNPGIVQASALSRFGLNGRIMAVSILDSQFSPEAGAGGA